MKEEGVSICIPTYNGQPYLHQALQSAVNQTYPFLEILIVDDGSTDDTLAIADSFAARHTHVRIVKNSAKQGMVANWTRCVEEARFGWIKFLFQDDILGPDCVAKLMDLVCRTKALIGFCRRDFLIEANAPEASVYYAAHTTKAEQLFAGGVLPALEVARQVVRSGTENILGEPSCLLFHKQLLQQIGGFDHRFYQSVDFEFALRAALQTGISFTPEPLVQFRIHGGSQTSANTGAKEDNAILKKNIRSLWGDDILLLHTYLSDARFGLIKQLWTGEELVSLIRYKYVKACREFGVCLVKEALQEVIESVPEIQNIRYNYLRYKLEKYRYQLFLKRRRASEDL